MPIECRLAAPAPEATTSGSEPRMNANDVIKIGRKRSRAASRAASRISTPALATLLGELHDEDRVLAGQTDQQGQADLRVDVVGHAR